MPEHSPVPIEAVNADTTPHTEPMTYQTRSGLRLMSLTGVLHAHYDMTVTTVTQIGSAAHTGDARVELDDGRIVFVRIHPGASDSTRISDTIDVLRRAVDAGIPGPQPIPDDHGALVNTRYDRSVTVWTWIDATPRHTWTAATAQIAGKTLARLHHALHNTPVRAHLRTHCPPYESASIDEHDQRLGMLQQHLQTLPRPWVLGDDADLDRITRRRQHLHLLPDLINRHPKPRVGVTHGAYRPEHLLFTGAGQLAGIVGYQPAKGVLADEIAQAAFDPATIAGTPRWLALAMTFLHAYLEEGGPVTAGHLAGCHRLALAHYLTDIADWHRLYHGPYPVNVNEIHRRNARRDTAITQLINQWDQVEDMMAGIGANPLEKLRT